MDSGVEPVEELRVYIVVQQGLGMSRHALARVAALAVWSTLRDAEVRDDPRFGLYDEQTQPKIGLRVKNEGHLLRALQEAKSAGIPCGLVEVEPGVPAALGIGPITRSGLPRFVANLQMLGDAEPEAPQASAGVEQDAQTMWILIRADAQIPYGKLAAQSGHGAWGALGVARNARPTAVRGWEQDGLSVSVHDIADLDDMVACHGAAVREGLPSAFITDAGRTVFNQPTPTVVGIGPCLRSELPPEVVSRIGSPDPVEHPSLKV